MEENRVEGMSGATVSCFVVFQTDNFIISFINLFPTGLGRSLYFLFNLVLFRSFRA